MRPRIGRWGSLGQVQLHVSGLAASYKRSPNLITDPEIKACLLHLLREKIMATRSVLVAVSALAFCYRHVLNRPADAIEQALPSMKKAREPPAGYVTSGQRRPREKAPSNT
jgi:hypothetical protein